MDKYPMIKRTVKWVESQYGWGQQEVTEIVGWCSRVDKTPDSPRMPRM